MNLDGVRPVSAMLRFNENIPRVRHTALASDLQTPLGATTGYVTTASISVNTDEKLVGGSSLNRSPCFVPTMSRLGMSSRLPAREPTGVPLPSASPSDPVLSSTAPPRQPPSTGASGFLPFSMLLAALIGVGLLTLRSFVERPYPVHPPGLVLITGTSSGIGHETVRLLSSKGYHCMAAVRQDADMRKWEEERGEDKDMLFRVTPIKLDVTDHSSIEDAHSAVQTYLKENPGLHFSGVVSNAGIGYHCPIEDMPMHDVRKVFDVNTLGGIALVQRFIPLLRQHKGRIIFLSSLAGRIVQPKEGVYAASKHAIEAIGDALRQELMYDGVSVSLIEPGFVDTPILRKILHTEDISNSTSAHEHYPWLYTWSYRKTFEQAMSRAASPVKVAEIVYKALTSRYPNTRYTVTSVFSAPTWFCMLVKGLLPDRLFDRIVTNV